MTKVALALVFAVASVIALLWRSDSATAQDLSPGAARGFAIVSKKCAECHATARSDASPLAKAPAFRTLGYPRVISLEKEFADGLIVGHMDMPQFKFDADEIAALIAYLKYVQEPR